MQLNELDKGLELYDESLEIANKTRDDEKAMKAHMYMATVCKMKRYATKAIGTRDLISVSACRCC